MNEEKTLAEILTLVREAGQGVTITYIARKSRRSWPTARVYLLRLLAEGRIQGEVVAPRGWVFRAKQQELQVTAP